MFSWPFTKMVYFHIQIDDILYLLSLYKLIDIYKRQVNDGSSIN